MVSPVFLIISYMSFELYIASKLNTQNNNEKQHKTTKSLSIAVFGITLSIIIMLLSITIVCGFKKEITDKIYNLDSHIKIQVPHASNLAYDTIVSILTENIDTEISNISYIIDKPAILKTNTDFNGVVYKGVNNNFNWNYINNMLIEGRVPTTENTQEIIISKQIAQKLQLAVGQKINTYFIDNSAVKLRNSEIVGIYNTDFVDFDNTYILGNINQLELLNSSDNNFDKLIGVNCNEINDIDHTIGRIIRLLDQNNFKNQYKIYSTVVNNASYFTWLELLDMNVVIIIVIMLSVSSFTLISAMLMIVLERVNTIGLLKSLGCSNKSIRKIFIYLTNRLILKSLLWGNLIGLGISFIQQHYQVIKLNAEAYYISHVPIEINWYYIMIFNVCIILIAYISLILPSKIITGIQPHKSIKFE